MIHIKSAICQGCTHYRDPGSDPDAAWNTGSCEAYPEPNGIPLSIFLGAADHRRSFEGDQGIRFEPTDAAAAEYAEQVFTDGPKDENNSQDD